MKEDKGGLNCILTESLSLSPSYFIQIRTIQKIWDKRKKDTNVFLEWAKTRK